MSAPSSLLERNRIVGKEDENTMLGPPDPTRWVPPSERANNALIHIGYNFPIEQLPSDLQTQFDDEIPSQRGFTSFGRVYRDATNGHIEACTGESTGVVELIRRGHRGDEYVHKVGRFLYKIFTDPTAMERLRDIEEGLWLAPIERIVKRTLGFSGKTCGMHENYLALRAIDLKPETADRAYGPVLMSHVTTRLWSFAGGVRGIGNKGYEFVAGAKLCDIEKDYSEETTSNKPLINTRSNSPYANAEKYRRIHITSGDGNMWPWPEFMKFTTASLVLRLVENGIDCSDVIMDDPLAAARECAMIGINGPAELNDRIQGLSIRVNGEPMHPLDLQLKLVEKCETMAKSCYISPEEEYALVKWREICELMLKDALKCGKYVEFIGKLVVGSQALDRRTKDKRGIVMGWNEFENAWCSLDPADSVGIRTRNQLQSQQDIMSLDLMPHERTRHDARAEAIAWGQSNMNTWPYNVRFYWDALNTFKTVSQLEPYNHDSGPWIDLLQQTLAQ